MSAPAHVFVVFEDGVVLGTFLKEHAAINTVAARSKRFGPHEIVKYAAASIVAVGCVSNLPGLLTPDQAAEALGVGRQTLAVWRCVKRYDLPYVKVGKLVRYRESDIEAFINARLQT